MTKQLDPSKRNAKCPRCSYDLRGAIETWKEQCPLSGRCAECGLEVKWAEVLCPEKFEPQWCVEFAPFRKRLLQSCGKTFIRSFWPFRFWSMLKMSLDIRWGRLAIYLVALLLPILLGYVCVQSAMAIRVRSHMQEQVDQWQITVQSQIAAFNSNRQALIQLFKDNYQQRKDRLEALLLFRDNLNLEDQNSIEPTQAWIEAVDEQGLDAWVQQQVQTQSQILQQTNASISMSHSYLSVIAEAVFLPWKDTSVSSLGTSWGIQTYPSPSNLRQYINYNIDEYYKYSDREFYTTVAYVLLGFLTCLFFPLTFIFLPISRKRAKVRWGHVLRVTCYSAFIPSTVICLALAAASVGYIFKGAADSGLGVAQFANRYLMLPMLIIWWAVAIKRYLCIAHGWVVAILLTAMLAMGYVFVLWQLIPSFLIDRY